MMRTLRQVGFFRDIPLGAEGEPSVKDMARASPQPDEMAAIAYLRQGTFYGFTPSVVPDVLAPGQPIIGELKYLTDGDWLWRSDLVHYVEHHHCALPDEFLAHMRAQGWKPPAASEIDLSTLQVGYANADADEFIDWKENP